jgi:hypothetical protein
MGEVHQSTYAFLFSIAVSFLSEFSVAEHIVQYGNIKKPSIIINDETK